MTKTKKITLIITAAVLLIGSAFLIFGLVSTNTARRESAIVEEKPLEPIPFPEKLAMALSQTSSSTTEDGRSKFTLEATITPADAYDTYVTWSVVWGEGASRSGENVTDYVTVTPESEGSLIATVECLRPFYGDTIIVTVATRDGGYTANCECTYTIIPSDISCYFDNSYYNATDKAYRFSPGTHNFTFDYTIASEAYYDIGSNGYNVSYEINGCGSSVPVIGYDDATLSNPYKALDNIRIDVFDLFDFEMTSNVGGTLTINNHLEDALVTGTAEHRYAAIDLERLVDEYGSNLVITCTISDKGYPELQYSFDFLVQPKAKLDLIQFNTSPVELTVGQEYRIPYVCKDATGRVFYPNANEVFDLYWKGFSDGTVPMTGGYTSILLRDLASQFLEVALEWNDITDPTLVIKPISKLDEVKVYVDNEIGYSYIDVDYIRFDNATTGNTELTLGYNGYGNKVEFNFNIVVENVSFITLNKNIYSFIGTGVEETKTFSAHDISWGTTYGAGDYSIEALEYMTTETSDFIYVSEGHLASGYPFRDYGIFEVKPTTVSAGKFGDPNALTLRLKNLSTGKTKLSFTMLYRMNGDDYYCFPASSQFFMKNYGNLDNVVWFFNMSEDFVPYIDDDFVWYNSDSEENYLKISFDLTFDWGSNTYSWAIYDANGKNITSMLNMAGKETTGSFAGLNGEKVEFKYQIPQNEAYNCEGNIAFSMIDLSYSVVEE